MDQSADQRFGRGSGRSVDSRAASAGASGSSSQSYVSASNEPSHSTPQTSTETNLSNRKVEKATLQPDPTPVSSNALSLPRRPGYGTAGEKIVVRANHFLVEVSCKNIHRYHVSIKPEILSIKVRRSIIKRVEDIYKESHLNGRSLAYDGGNIVYTAGALPFQSKKLVVELPDNPFEASTSTRRKRKFTVAIQYTSKRDTHHLQQFIRGEQLDMPEETLAMLNVILRATPSSKYTSVGQSFFSLQLGPKGELGGGVEYWKGYYQSLRPTKMGLSLNIHNSVHSFYEAIPVTDFVKKCINLKEFSRPLSNEDRLKVLF